MLMEWLSDKMGCRRGRAVRYGKLHKGNAAVTRKKHPVDIIAERLER
jgi:hypothetical protein